MSNSPDQADLVIVCALHDPELKYARSTSGVAWNRLPPAIGDPGHYWDAEFSTKEGTRLRVVAGHANQMGPTAMAVLTSRMLMRFRPRLVAMVGIAAGARTDSQDYGDILIAERTFAHDSGKRCIEKGKIIFRPDHHPLETAPDLIPLLGSWTSDHARDLADIKDAFPNPPRSSLKAHLGPLASGSLVIDEAGAVDEIRGHWRKLIGLEMEAYSAHRACHDMTVPDTPFVCMKSVCDFAQNKKDDWQAYAAHTSSSFLWKFIGEEWERMFPGKQTLSPVLFYSGARSLEVAENLCSWLSSLALGVQPVLRQIEDASSAVPGSVAVLCITPENSNSPNLLFGAGSLIERVGQSGLFALLFGLDAGDLPQPISRLSSFPITPEWMVKLLQQVSARYRIGSTLPGVIEKAVTAHWAKLERRWRLVESRVLPEHSIPQIIGAFSKKSDLPQPALGQVAFFESGFESHSLYSIACSVAAKRLLVFGRKNRKLFDKDHRQFFEGLGRKVESGFDFRCLFLDAESPQHIIDSAHEDSDFRDQLVDCLKKGCETLTKQGLDPTAHFRIYSCPRTSSLLIVDDAVLSTPIHIGATGKAMSLTKCGFTAVSTGTDLGKRMERQFNRAWKAASVLKS